MNNCMNCGAMLLEGAAVCPVCRQPIGPAQGAGWQPPAAPPVAPWQPPAYYAAQHAASSNKSLNAVWLVAIGFLLLMIVGGVAGAIVYIKSQRATFANNNGNRNYSRPAATPYDSDSASPPPPTPPGSRTSRDSKPISGGVLNGKAISLPQPPYPAVAKAARASGTVTVQVTVDESGKVTSARAISGHPLLQAAAVQAAYQARFSPTMLAGKPVKVTGVLTYKFELE
ncbi:MAG TPA: TonB family protein [Pyrinomonadaceae bacterium]